MTTTLIRTGSLALIVICLAGCAGTAWKKAASVNTTAGYEHFLQKFPDSWEADLARVNLQCLHYDQAKTDGRIAQDINRMKVTAGSVLSRDAKVEVTTRSEPQSQLRPRFTIEIHDLAGDGLVGGLSHPEFRRQVESICAAILRAVDSVELPSIECEIMIDVYYRLDRYYEGVLIQRNVDTLIYDFAIDIAKMRTNDLAKLNNDAIMHLGHSWVDSIDALSQSPPLLRP